MENRFTFEEIIQYAEKQGLEHRGEKSRAFDYTHTYWYSPFTGDIYMVLYEGKKRIIRGHKTAEVCWVCVRQDGVLSSVPSRYFRKYYEPIQGFVFNDAGRQKIVDILNSKEDCLL